MKKLKSQHQQIRHTNNLKIFIFLLFTTLFYYLPILFNPPILLNRGNDLEEQFWPVFYLIRKSIWENQTFPLWNNLWFSGMPLLPDPQFSLIYPGNFLFYFFPTDAAFLLYFIIHTFIGGIGVYLAARYGLKFSEKASIFAGVLYILIPKASGYIEAGHFGLAGSLAWVPFVLLGVIQLTRELKVKWAILLAISLANLFFTHTVNFLVILFSSLVIFLITLFTNHTKKVFLKAIFLFTLAGILTVGLTAITLLPQLEWLPTTTRSLLLNDRAVYPQWTGVFEFLQNIFLPLLRGSEKLWSIDTEKWLAIGITPTLLSTLGFLQLKNKLKFFIFISFVTVSLIALNNASPLRSFLLSQDLYVFARVSTRVWVIPTTLVVFLAAFGFDKMCRSSYRNWAYTLVTAIIIESLTLSWFRLMKPVPVQTQFVNEEVHHFLAADKDHFRVFCVTRCLSQKKAAIYNLELIEGYNTLQQKNYFDEFIQLSQVYWDKYTLPLPPFEIYKHRQIQPFTPELADYNVRYVISPHKLTDKNLVLKRQVDNYLIYEKIILKKRAFFSNGAEAPITIYSPNFIQVNTNGHPSLEFTLSEVWSPGWKVYLNGKEETVILEPKNKLRNVKIKEDTKFVDFKYQPDSFIWGSLVTILSLSFIILFGVIKWKNTKR